MSNQNKHVRYSRASKSGATVQDDESDVAASFAGVRDPRPIRQTRAVLDDPRKPANRDWLALERRNLWLEPRTDAGDQFPYFTTPSLERKSWRRADPNRNSRDAFYVAPDKFGVPPGPVAPQITEAAQQEDIQGRLTLLIYRYTKQVELVNDDMGYGERIAETYWIADLGAVEVLQLKSVSRVSQRTKTGRQYLYSLGDAKLTKRLDHVFDGDDKERSR